MILKNLSIQAFITVCFMTALSVSASSQDKPNKIQEETEAEKTQAAPEKDTGKSKKQLVLSKKFMVVTANKHATKAGYDMLKQGGSAVDAMIAAQLVLNLVEPQSSGIGGGAFLLHWNKAAKKLTTYDGRETAPSSAKPDHFLDKNGKPLGFIKAIRKGLGIGVPGVVKLMEDAHNKHGKLAWAKLFEPAIQLSENGFKVSERLHKMLTFDKPEYFGPKAKALFFDENNKPRPVGYLLKNQELAATFRQLAANGSKAFYKGPFAEQLVKTIKTFSKGKNGISMQDLASYKVKQRKPVCFMYRKYNICSMGPPSSGAHTIGIILKLIEPYNLKGGAEDHQVLHYIAEAQKLAYADRGRYLADTDFSPLPGNLLEESYLEERRKKIQKYKAMAKAEPGVLKTKQGSYGKDASVDRPGTTHLSIIDAQGNAVSMTSSIETRFGSRVLAGGFLLNNQLTDFSFKPTDNEGKPIANRVEGGKRPRSSMSPTIVFNKEGEVVLVLGSPGGSRIINYVIKTLVAMIDWGMDQQAAVELANFGSRNGPFEMEKPAKGTTKLFLKTFGHKVKVTEMNSGLHVILKAGDEMYSGVDPRREGTAMGE